ncbi:MAG: glycerol-3-phosphate dehydrogenase/oxidase [Aridibacter sp.]
MLTRVKLRQNPFDIIIIGGGASGVGCAVDAASRGFDVLLLEQSDFGKGTSSRSTKLVHGGVRYLEQGNISLVREALKERGILKQNAPHIVHSQAFIIPSYSFWQKFYFGAGLKIYDFLSGKYSFGKSKVLSKKETLEKLSNIKQENLSGGIIYFDGQFDDARLLIDLALNASENNACLLNYARVFGLTKNVKGKINGVNFEDTETGELFSIKAKVVINATGAFTDEIRKLSNQNSNKIISPSQGIHLVFDESFLSSEDAIMIPKTSDGRVLFIIPWNGKTIVGTTDTPIENATLEPQPLEEEIEFILKTCKNYLSKSPQREDILSVFVGIRPLVKSSDAKNTAKLSRDHTIEIDDADLLTLTGGKWTTYRNMAEDAVNKAIEITDLPDEKCVTEKLKIKNEQLKKVSEIIQENSQFAEKLHEDFPYKQADVVNSVRNEMARTVEDVLARRTRILFLDAKAAIEISRETAEIMADELKKDKNWIDEQVRKFEEIAQNYLV